ncbi:TniB family NTP-binding protein [Pseudomonas sp. abacavir_1]
MIDYPHVAPGFQHLLGLSDAERLEFLEQPLWIDYPIADKVITYLHSVLNKPRRPRMPNVMLVGESNNGKTTLINRFIKICAQAYVNEEAESVIPVIAIELSKTDVRQLYVKILESFWAPFNVTAPIEKLRNQTEHMFRSCKTRMLIIDEIQVLRKGSPIKVREVMDEIKSLANVLQISVVGVGVPQAVQLLNADAQYASRFEVLTLPPWSLRGDFQSFLKSYERALPLKKASRLYSRELTPVIHSITGGNTGYVEYLLVNCAKDAIVSGSEMIDRRMLEKHQWKKSEFGIREVTL